MATTADVTCRPVRILSGNTLQLSRLYFAAARAKQRAQRADEAARAARARCAYLAARADAAAHAEAAWREERATLRARLAAAAHDLRALRLALLDKAERADAARLEQAEREGGGGGGGADAMRQRAAAASAGLGRGALRAAMPTDGALLGAPAARAGGGGAPLADDDFAFDAADADDDEMDDDERAARGAACLALERATFDWRMRDVVDKLAGASKARRAAGGLRATTTRRTRRAPRPRALSSFLIWKLTMYVYSLGSPEGGALSSLVYAEITLSSCT